MKIMFCLLINILALVSSATVKAGIITPSDLGPPTAQGSVGIPAATFSDGSGGFDKSQTTLGTISGSFTSTDGGTGSGQSTTSASQAVSVNLNLVAGSDPVFGIGGKATATLSYVMYINDPTNESVQVHINASGGATFTSSSSQELNTQLQSTLLIEGNNFALGFGQNLSKGSNQLNPDAASFSWSTNQDYTFQTDTRYDVVLTTVVQSSAHRDATATLSAFVDPIFTIDSLDPDQFQIVFSEGITNNPDVANAVPEPSTWAMMLLGFAGLGFVTYRRKAKAVLSVLTALAVFGMSSAKATVIIDMQQVGSNVVATGSGTLDLTDLNLVANENDDALVWPNANILVLASGVGSPAGQVFGNIAGPSNFGPSFSVSTADSSSGSHFGLFEAVTSPGLLVPTGYDSGASLSATATWDNQTLASLGVTPGVYVWTWGTGVDADSLTLNVTAAVPEPSTWAMLLFGFAGIGFMVYRRKSKVAWMAA